MDTPVYAVLLSGGIESTTLLYAAPVLPSHALFINYGQRAATQERRAAQHQSSRSGVVLATLEAPEVGKQMNALRGLQYHVPFPERNLWLLALAINWAVAARVSHLYLGWNAADGASDPSVQQDALPLWGHLSSHKVTLEAPFLHLSKAAIIRRGRTAGIDYRNTYSCLRGHARACGRCPQCQARAQALQQADADGSGA